MSSAERAALDSLKDGQIWDLKSDLVRRGGKNPDPENSGAAPEWKRETGVGQPADLPSDATR